MSGDTKAAENWSRMPGSNGDIGSVLDEHATERELAQVFINSLPPLKCVSDNWYLYQKGYWKKTDKSIYQPRALGIQHESKRKSRMATSVLTHVEYQHQIDRETLRSFHYMNDDGEVFLNCNNGVLKVAKEKLTLLQHSEEYCFTCQIAADYDSAAVAATFYHVLKDALPEADDVLLFETFTGSILYPDSRFEAALCCYGSTGTSKSTLATGIKAALGPDIITNLTLQQICDPKCFHLHKLHCSAVNIATELNALAVSSENFKRLVSGEPVDADRKYLDSVNMETTNNRQVLVLNQRATQVC
jgi:phage/plasmid-associated DNA primase